MSMSRICPNCYRKEDARFNFGDEHQAEKAFHAEKWCKCGYNSPQEMMLDQDMGFEDPLWIPIAKYFINNYTLRISQGEIRTKEEHMRFFLKLLKNSANNFNRSLELAPRDKDEAREYIYHGRTTHVVKSSIFDENSKYAKMLQAGMSLKSKVPGMNFLKIFIKKLKE